MAHAKNHDYHILRPSIWPLLGALSALIMTSGGVLYMHDIAAGKFVLPIGFAGVRGDHVGDRTSDDGGDGGGAGGGSAVQREGHPLLEGRAPPVRAVVQVNGEGS